MLFIEVPIYVPVDALHWILCIFISQKVQIKSAWFIMIPCTHFETFKAILHFTWHNLWFFLFQNLFTLYFISWNDEIQNPWGNIDSTLCYTTFVDCSIFDTVLSHIRAKAVYCVVNGQVLVYMSVGIFHIVLFWWIGPFISALTMQCSKCLYFQ